MERKAGVNSTKRCTKCEKRKRISEFYKRPDRKSGVRSRCKVCEQSRNLEYYQTNTKTERERAMKWYYGNLEKAREKDYKRYRENAEKIKANAREWYRTNKEQARRSNQEWNKRNKDRRIAIAQNRRARLAGSIGKVSAEELRKMNEFYDYTCLRCGEREPSIKLTHDHVKPIVMGGENTIENSQPLCRSCNSKKKDKWIDYREKWRIR